MGLKTKFKGTKYVARAKLGVFLDAFQQTTLEKIGLMFVVDVYVNNMYVQAQREQRAKSCFQETLALFFQVPRVKTTHSLMHIHPLT